MHTTFSRLFVLGCVLTIAASLRAEESSPQWSQWRNADGNGVSLQKNLPTKWSESSGVVWKCKLPEWGNSSPVVAGDGVFLTSHLDDKQLVLIKVDKATGKIAWIRQVGEGSAARIPLRRKTDDQRRHQNFHKLHNMATPSPATDGQLVVASFGGGDLAAYDLQGKQLWHRNMQKEHGDYTVWWGFGNSPVLYEDLVIVVAMQDSCADLPGEPVESYVAAYNKKSGKPVWKTVRHTKAKGEACDSFTTPILRNNNETVASPRVSDKP